MNANIADFAALETPLDEEPLFPVEPPDGKKLLSEDDRCGIMLRLMHLQLPKVLIYHVANEGKRHPGRARKIGIHGGAFDYELKWHGGTACLEMKGYTKAGRPGALSDNQIRFGNRLHAMGHPVACFFDPEKAVAWVRGLMA